MIGMSRWIAASLAPVLALAFAMPSAAAEKDMAGYTPERAALAASLPVHIVALNTRVRPQMGFKGVDVALPPPGFFFGPDISPAQTLGVGLATGLIARGITYGTLYLEARDSARAAFAPIQRAGCDLPVEAPLQQAIAAAVRRSPWGAAATPVLAGADDKALDTLVAGDQPRQVFALTASLSPDLDRLITSVDIAAYAPLDGESGWRGKPLWRDHLIVVSDGLSLRAKTRDDSARMLADEQARYDASGTEALIKRLNAQGGNASKSDRKAARAALELHARNLEDAGSGYWSSQAAQQRRAALWNENACARLHAAIDQAGVEIGGMLDALYAQTLPKRLGLKDKNLSYEPPRRQIRALSGGVYVSRADAGRVSLSYRTDLLPLQD